MTRIFHYLINVFLHSYSFWFKKYTDACAQVRADEEVLAALDREIELVERQKAEIERAHLRHLAAASQRKTARSKLRSFFKIFRRRK